MKFIKIKKIKLLMLCAIISVLLVGTLFGTYGVAEPNKIKIELSEERDFPLDLPITKACTYEVGVMFYGENKSHIKNAFGGVLDARFPLDLDLEIVNSENQMVFNKSMFDGQKVNVRYGPNPVMFIAGTSYLLPGDYIVNISINKENDWVLKFDTYFFAKHTPKTRC